MALRRAIDRFADHRPAFVARRARISPTRRRGSGVLVDFFYEHWLARDWADDRTGSLDATTTRLYDSLRDSHGVFPESAWAVARYMQTHDWLGSYCNVAVVGRAIARMAVYRLRRADTLAGGIEEFLAAVDFKCFLPDALAFSEGWRARRDCGRGKSTDRLCSLDALRTSGELPLAGAGSV